MLDRVIVVPRNGYANRLQAWASAHALAADVGARLRVVWEPEAVATTPAHALFDTETVTEHFMGSTELEALLGMPQERVHRYLTHLPDRRVIVLAGHDRGEQAFMPELAVLVSRLSEPTALVVIAGGTFHLTGDPDPRARRREFYRSLGWHPDIDARANDAIRGHGPFAALHVRATDRSVHAATRRTMRSGLESISDLTPQRSLFICADSAEARRLWASESARLGFTAWSVQDVEFDRASEQNGVSAMVDWRLLAAAAGVVHPAVSTFSAEAVVAGGTESTSIALQAGPLTQAVRQSRVLATSLATYPAHRLRRRDA